MNRPQNSDRLSMHETLAAMERLGRPEEYRQGYEDGFDRRPGPRFGDPEPRAIYIRGYRAGIAARRRGAHGGEA